MQAFPGGEGNYAIDQNDQKVQTCLDKIRFTDDPATIDQVLSSHADNAAKNLVFALNAEPLKVTTSRIYRA